MVGFLNAIMKVRRVSIVIFYNKGKILLQDRTGYKKPRKRYGFFGGGIKDKETPEQALVREIKEELNFNIRNFRFIGKFSIKKNQYFKVVNFTFVSRLSDISKLKQKEGKGMRLVDLETARKLLRPKHRKFISYLKKNIQLIE
jgi:8-oxo-dGTP pyrophosphatase MutT (NUDIX family)